MEAAEVNRAEACFPTPSSSDSLNILQRAKRAIGIPLPRIPNYVWCVAFTAIGGFLFGFDTGSIGPVTTMHTFQAQFAPDVEKGISPTVQGLIVSSILITASLASVASGPLSDRISRTRTISLGAAVFAVGSAIACSASALPQLFVGRCIAGVGEGLFLSVVTVYAIEVAPASTRGRMGTAVQLFITIGLASGASSFQSSERLYAHILVLGYFVCYGTSRLPSSLSWRFPLGMQAVVAMVLCIGSPFLPHSPRWLRHVGRDAEADASWIKLGVSGAEAEKSEESTERTTARRDGVWKETQQLWKKNIRGRTALGVFLMGMQQASGIDGVLYVSLTIFPNAYFPVEMLISFTVCPALVHTSGSIGTASIFHRFRRDRSCQCRMHNCRAIFRGYMYVLCDLFCHRNSPSVRESSCIDDQRWLRHCCLHADHRLYLRIWSVGH